MVLIMEELRMLLEAEGTIKERIGGALAALKEWFKEKKAEVKNKFGELKAAVLKKIGKVDKEKQAEATKKGKHQEGKRGCYRDSSLHFVPF